MVTAQPTQKIHQRLRKAGFVVARRAGGSHTVWTGPNNTKITLPDGHREISPGVVRQVDKVIRASQQA